MPEPANQPANPSATAGTAEAARRDWRFYFFWGVWLGLVALLGLIGWFLLRPVLQVRAELNTIISTPGPAPDGEEAVERLGGPHRACRKIRLYLALEERPYPERRASAYLLGWCGREAIPTLAGMLRERDEALPGIAGEALKRIDGEEPRQ